VLLWSFRLTRVLCFKVSRVVRAGRVIRAIRVDRVIRIIEGY
jgi:hypothetical protein